PHALERDASDLRDGLAAHIQQAEVERQRAVGCGRFANASVAVQRSGRHRGEFAITSDGSRNVRRSAVLLAEQRGKRLQTRIKRSYIDGGMIVGGRAFDDGAELCARSTNRTYAPELRPVVKAY